MKIALKFGSQTKIYNGDIDYQQIINFSNKQFNLKNSTYTLTFLDEDEDEITLCTNADLEKSIVKIYIKLETNTLQQVQEITNIQEKQMKSSENSDKPEILQEEPVESPKLEEPIKKEECSKQRWRGRHKHRHHNHEGGDSSSSSKERKWGKFRKMRQFWKDAIAKQVDERIQTLIPCIKNQLNGGNPIKLFSVSNPLVHENVECKSCLAIPITGIRYQCQTCPNFNLCESCQTSVEHQHNLLKIKYIMPEEQKEEQNFPGCVGMWKRHHHGPSPSNGRDFPFGFFKKWRKHHGDHGHGHSHEQSSSSRSLSKFKDPEFWTTKKMGKLAKAFGGEPEEYRAFVVANSDLKIGQTIFKYAKQNNKTLEPKWESKMKVRKSFKLARIFGGDADSYNAFIQANITLDPKQLVEEYAKVNNISEVQLKEKRLNCKCQKLGLFFNKDPESFKEFVSNHLDLRPHQLKKLLIEQKIEKRPEECFWKKRECKQQEKKEKTGSHEKKQRKTSEKKRELHQEKKRKHQSKDKDAHEKGEILQVLVQYFGVQNIRDYYKVIEQHFGKGKQKIIEIYLETHTK